MARKMNPQSLSIILGGGIVALTAAGFITTLGGFALPFAGEAIVGLAGMVAGARVA